MLLLANAQRGLASRAAVEIDLRSRTPLVRSGVLWGSGRHSSPALALLINVTAHARHYFWPDLIANDRVRWHSVLGHRQVTDADLAALARYHIGKLATFDKGLVALHTDVGVAVDA